MLSSQNIFFLTYNIMCSNCKKPVDNKTGYIKIKNLIFCGTECFSTIPLSVLKKYMSV